MRRCTRGKRSNSAVRMAMIAKQSRGLTIKIFWNRNGQLGGRHRRHGLKIHQAYRDPPKREIFEAGLMFVRVGKTLRNRKHHVPRYKCDRVELEWFIRVCTKSANSRWTSARIDMCRLIRNSRKLHPEHMENMLVKHWWQI